MQDCRDILRGNMQGKQDDHRDMKLLLWEADPKFVTETLELEASLRSLNR